MDYSQLSPFELGETYQAEAIPYLIRFLATGTTNERRLAASAITKLYRVYPDECKRTKLLLIENLMHEGPQVRQYCLKALLKMELSADEISEIKSISEFDEKEYNRNVLHRLIRKKSNQSPAPRVNELHLDHKTGNNPSRDRDRKVGEHILYSQPFPSRNCILPMAKLVSPDTTEKLVSDSEPDAHFFRMLERKNIHLNEKQLAAVRHVDGPCLTIAGAGTGKTTVLTTRTAYLIAMKEINPAHILLMTFTRKAADEMKDRIGRLISTNISKMVIGTFHSAFLRILKHHGLKEELVSNPLHRQSIFRTKLRELGLDNTFEPEEAMAIISSLKINLIDPNSKLVDDDVRNIWLSYEAWKTENNQIDFDDILVRTYELLRSDTTVLASLQRRFAYILVDEWQDTNRVQYEILRLLAAPQNNLFVVGDPDQTIYSFAGADVEIILGFDKAYPGAAVIKLDVNYRSTTHIIGLGNEVIRHNKSRIPNTLHGTKSSPDAPKFISPPASYEEADFLVEQVVSEVNSGLHQFRDYAVLYRTTSTSQALIERLLADNIPFIDNTDQRSSFFYETTAVKPILSLLRLSLMPDSMTDIRNVLPSLYVKREEGMDWIEQRQSASPIARPLEHLYELPGLADFRRNKLEEQVKRIEELRDLPADRAVQLLRPDYEAFAFQRKGNILTSYKDTIKEALDTLQLLASHHSNIMGFIEHIENLRQKYDAVRRLRQETNPDAINLMTIHKSKGLEFPVVWAIGFSDGILPHHLALEASKPRDMFVRNAKDNPYDPMMEEERRLAYVCITRAKDELIISSPAEVRTKKADVSLFLRQALSPPKEIKPKREHSSTSPVASGAALKSSKNETSETTAPAPVLHQPWYEIT